jgi:site-specific recombinase XerD
MSALKHSFHTYPEFFDNFMSEHTRVNYQSDLNGFFTFMFEQYPSIKKLEQVERVHIINFRNFLGETGGKDGEPCAPKTIARKLASLSSYFDYLVEKGEREFNPVLSVKRPRREVMKPTQALKKEQVLEIFAILGQDLEKHPSRYLHKALLVTFFTTGMRKSEVMHLRFKDYRDINEDKVMEFIGKGGKVGQKLLHPLCVEALETYLAWMRGKKREHNREDWLFQPNRNPKNPGELNKPLNPKTINEILQSYGKRIGLNFSISPHSARATFIGELLEAGVDIYTVAREVNHSSVKTTQEYDKRRKKIKDSPIGKLPY